MSHPNRNCRTKIAWLFKLFDLIDITGFIWILLQPTLEKDAVIRLMKTESLDFKKYLTEFKYTVSAVSEIEVPFLHFYDHLGFYGARLAPIFALIYSDSILF